MGETTLRGRPRGTCQPRADELGKEDKMIQDGTYNGWTNRDTWLAHLWLTGSESGTYSDAVRVVREYEDPLRFLIAMLDALGNPDDINYSRVNWQEVIEALREE